MPKDTFYFTHDYNARKDPKCSALIRDFGAKGYGIFWMLIEIIYEQGGKIKKFPSLISGLAFEFSVPEDELSKQIEAMLHKYELLCEDASHIWSNTVLIRLQIRDDKRSKKSSAGKKGGIKSGESRRSEAKRSNASMLRKQNEANEAKESKVKENKVKEINKRIETIFFDLSELEIGQTKQFLFYSKQIELSDAQILDKWKAFWIREFQEESASKSHSEIIKHFRNSLKNEKFEGNKVKPKILF